MSLEGRTIALVEDDLIMGESLADRLSLEGARVLWWQSCEAAAANLETTMPDLVVCDIRLPDGSGEDVFRAASSAPHSSPFLFVTAYGEIDQAVRLMRDGAGDYVTKPFDMASFLGRVEQLLRPTVESGAPVLGVSPQMPRDREDAAAHRLAFGARAAHRRDRASARKSAPATCTGCADRSRARSSP